MKPISWHEMVRARRTVWPIKNPELAADRVERRLTRRSGGYVEFANPWDMGHMIGSTILLVLIFVFVSRGLEIRDPYHALLIVGAIWVAWKVIGWAVSRDRHPPPRSVVRDVIDGGRGPVLCNLIADSLPQQELDEDAWAVALDSLHRSEHLPAVYALCVYGLTRGYSKKRVRRYLNWLLAQKSGEVAGLPPGDLQLLQAMAASQMLATHVQHGEWPENGDLLLKVARRSRLIGYSLLAALPATGVSSPAVTSYDALAYEERLEAVLGTHYFPDEDRDYLNRVARMLIDYHIGMLTDPQSESPAPPMDDGSRSPEVEGWS